MRLSLKSLIRPHRTEPNPRPELAYPLFPAPRMVVLGCDVQPAPGVHCLRRWTAAEVAEIRPLALAATYLELEQIAALMRRGELALPDLQYPLLVFSRPGDGALSPAQHDALWSWFGLPCFEQIRDADGRLLAVECEARDGFHLTADGDPANLAGRLLPTACECGQVTPRVRIGPAHVLTAQAGD